MVVLNKSVLWNLNVLSKLLVPLIKKTPGGVLSIQNARIATNDLAKLLSYQGFRFIACTFEVFVGQDENGKTKETILYPETMNKFEGLTQMNFYSLYSSQVSPDDLFFNKKFKTMGEYFKNCSEFAYMLDTNINNKYFLPAIAKKNKTESGVLSLQINKTLNHN